MIKKVIFLSVAMATVSGGALADQTEAQAKAEAKCVEAVSQYDLSEPEAKCACFVAKLTETQIEKYLEIRNWDDEATEELKTAGAICMPEIAS